MSRVNYNRKGAIVERLTNDKTKRSGVVRLDKSTMTFFARLPDDAPAMDKPLMIESKNGSEVTNWLRSQLAKSDRVALLEWLPAVSVSITSRDSYYRSEKDAKRQGFEIEVNRLYVALTLDKTEWLRLDWKDADPSSAVALAPEDRVAGSRHFQAGPKSEEARSGRSALGDRIMRSLPFHDRGDRSYIAYTPELWAALQNVLATMEAAEKYIRDLVTTKAGIETLISGGAQLLLAGPKDAAE